MVKRLVVLSLFILASGCGRFDVFGPPIVDGELIYYVNLYKSEKKVYTGIEYIRKIDVIFRSLIPPALAMCLRWSNGDRQIEIDPYTWYKKLSETERQLVLFHEMGHCDLNLGHIEEVGIMRAELMEEYYYLQDPDKYLKQLFNAKQ